MHQELAQAPAMARSTRGADVRPSLGEEVMEAVGSDLAGAHLPLGLGVGVVARAGSKAQEAKGPTGRHTPRTPTRSGGEVRSPQSPLNLNELDLEVEDGMAQQPQVQEERDSVGTVVRPTGVCETRDDMKAVYHPISTEPRLIRDDQSADEEELLEQGEVPFLANTPSTTESHRVFNEDDD